MNKTEKKVIEVLIGNTSLTRVELSEIMGLTKRSMEKIAVKFSINLPDIPIKKILKEDFYIMEKYVSHYLNLD